MKNKCTQNVPFVADPERVLRNVNYRFRWPCMVNFRLECIGESVEDARPSRTLSVQFFFHFYAVFGKNYVK